AMHDPFLVRGGESVRDLSRVFDRLANGNARAALVGEAVADLVAERLSFEQFHHDVRGVVVRADVIDRDEVRMIQRAGRTRLDLEAMQPVGIARDELRKNLDGDVALQTAVARRPDLTHSTRTDARANLVRTHSGSRRDLHGRWCS